MNKLQKKLCVFLLILSLGVLLSMAKAVKVVIGKNGEIGELSSKITDFTKKTQGLVAEVETKEQELGKVKADLEGLNYELKEEKNKASSFQSKYESEKEKRDNLESNLNKLKLALEEKSGAKEKFSVEIEKLREEKEQALRNLEEEKRAKEALEAFAAEGKGKPSTANAVATPFMAGGRIVTIYPQGLLGIELEKDFQDKILLGKIVKGQSELRISNIHSHMIILEVNEGEDITGFKKGDVIKYVR